MIWKYFIPHIWTDPRTVWEDVYLMPAEGDESDRSIWLTVDALGNQELPAERRNSLRGRQFVIEGTDMLVAADDFDKAELLDWARLWLLETGFQVTELMEASAADFRGTNSHACNVEQATAAMQEYERQGSSKGRKED